ncbi:MAG: insulinase family protein [Cyanobacteria bacterium RI_101]|nr:insulinase family protein [Cyanobacteria bacterium RI_101]
MPAPQRRKPLLWSVLLSLTLLLTLLIHPAQAQGEKALPFDELRFPPLPEIQLPQYERYVLPNGLTVYLIEDSTLPLIRGTALFRAGARWEPAEKTGLASLTGTVMRTGGTPTYSPGALNRELESRAAAIETSIGLSSGSASFDALSADGDWILGVFGEILQKPVFAPEQVALAQTQLRGAIARRNDDPGNIAGRELNKLIYGAGSPYARTVEYATLDAIQREDLIQFHQTYVRPDQMILGIVGDFQSAALKERINEVFGAWVPPAGKPQLQPPGAAQAQKNQLFLVEQPQLTQSNVFLGQLGGRIDSPDYPALMVMNGVLNGFGGRLFNTLRSQKGLAYSVSGRWQPGFDYPGTFVAGGQTRTETATQFIDALKTEIRRLRTEPITEKELAYAKESILNSFIFNFEKPQQTLGRLMTYDYYGYPQDFIFEYQRRVKETTIEDVRRVAQQYLQPDQWVTLVVGNNKELRGTVISDY